MFRSKRSQPVWHASCPRSLQAVSSEGWCYRPWRMCEVIVVQVPGCYSAKRRQASPVAGTRYDVVNVASQPPRTGKMLRKV